MARLSIRGRAWTASLARDGSQKLRLTGGAQGWPHVHAFALTAPSSPEREREPIHGIGHCGQRSADPEGHEALDVPEQGLANSETRRPRTDSFERFRAEPLQLLHGPPRAGQAPNASVD